jgi:hypothetical protein
MAHSEWVTSFDSDIQATMTTSGKLFAESADQPILIIDTHCAVPTAEHVQRDGVAFRFRV